MARYKDWVLDVFCWDGILPFVVVALPIYLIRLFANQQAIGEIAAIAMPFTAFFIRAAIGLKRFKRGEHFGWQKVLFCCVIMLLALVDCVYILFQTVPMGNQADAWLSLAALYGIYLVLISVALFPARSTLISVSDQYMD